MATTLLQTQTFTVIDLGCCGFSVGFPDSWIAAKKGDHSTFWCPNCKCSRHWAQETQKEKAIRLRKDAERRADQLEAQRDLEKKKRRAAERSKRAVKGHLTRQKKRAAHGVCPCCERSFKQLRRHMKSQHPDYVEANR